jgi:hypothetical protein
MKKFPLKLQILIYSSLFLISLKTLDWLLLEKLYFLIPNEMEWDTSPWYNFLHHRKKIQFDDEDHGILVLGSSIAMFSTLPELMQNEEERIKVNLYAHVAMAPTDAYYYLDDIIERKPKLVVYVINPADFQFEYVRKAESDQKAEEKSYYYDEKAWLNHFAWRHPSRVLYPWEFFRDYWRVLKMSDIYRLWGKAFLYINRYREFFWDPIDAWIERHWKNGRSYHMYTGMVPREGIWGHGWTTPEFQIRCESKNGTWKDWVYIPLPDTELEILSDSGDKTNLFFPKSGWHPIEFTFFNLETDKASETINGNPVHSVHIRVSKTIDSGLAENKPYGKNFPYGIRLSQNFCSSEREKDLSYRRPNTLDESRFRGMSLIEYESDYKERIYKDNKKRPELARMKILAETKDVLANEEFHPWIEIQRIQDIQDRLSDKSIRLLIILSPENPLELARYRNQKWYNGLLDYLGELSAGHFFDYSNFFSDPRYFSDPHHLTYEGAEIFTEELNQIIRTELHTDESGD